MTIWQWADSKIKHFRWYDISLIKLSVASAILALAKLWPSLLCLNWYWYALIALATATPIWRKMLRG